jgi:hypothetical protein
LPSAFGCIGFQKDSSRIKPTAHLNRFLHSLSAKAASFAERKATLISAPVLTGIVTAKTDKDITVKAEGAQKPER